MLVGSLDVLGMTRILPLWISPHAEPHTGTSFFIFLDSLASKPNTSCYVPGRNVPMGSGHYLLRSLVSHGMLSPSYLNLSYPS